MLVYTTITADAADTALCLLSQMDHASTGAVDYFESKFLLVGKNNRDSICLSNINYTISSMMFVHSFCNLKIRKKRRSL